MYVACPLAAFGSPWYRLVRQEYDDRGKVTNKVTEGKEQAKKRAICVCGTLRDTPA